MNKLSTEKPKQEPLGSRKYGFDPLEFNYRNAYQENDYNSVTNVRKRHAMQGSGRSQLLPTQPRSKNQNSQHSGKSVAPIVAVS